MGGVRIRACIYFKICPILNIKDHKFGMVTGDRHVYSYEIKLINLPSMKGKI